MSTLILIRHAQSWLFHKGKYNGWDDADLTITGIKESIKVSEKIKCFNFHCSFTSVQKRGYNTLNIIKKKLNWCNLETIHSDTMNEHYCDFTGLNAEEKKHRFHQWHIDYENNLRKTSERVIPYFREHIHPLLIKNENILVVAHGKSIRAIMLYIENKEKDEIPELDSCEPYFYEFDNNGNVIQHKFLKNE